MRRTSLTDLKIKQLKPSDKVIELFDSEVPALSIRVQKSGTKSFCFHYRDLCGKSVRATLGRYPDLSLAEAREKARTIRKDLANGVDPKLKKLKALDERKAGKISKVVAEHIEALKRRNKSAKESERILLRILVKPYGHLNIRDLDRALIRKICDDVTVGSGPTSGNQAFAHLRRVGRESVGRGYLDRSPCDGMKMPHKTVSRKRVLSAEELRAIWLASEHLGKPVEQFLKCLILTGQRRNEVAQLRWCALDFHTKRWTQAEADNKAGREHLVPVSDQTIAVLRSVPHLNDTYVFPGRGVSTPMSGFSKWKRKLDEISGVRNWTLHDLRRTVATTMSKKLNVPIHVIELILNHSAKDLRGVAGVYNLDDFEDEKRQALQSWADCLTRLVEVQPVNSIAETKELLPMLPKSWPRNCRPQL